jgi:5-methylcytosine-specific restriction endonuclease McrA
MNIPSKIGHNYTFEHLFPITDLAVRFSTHRRLRVFHVHGLKCSNASCMKEGVYLIKAKNSIGHFHIDLYTADFELMTIDHILPKSKGGSNSIENLQPMCHTCNTQKADIIK